MVPWFAAGTMTPCGEVDQIFSLVEVHVELEVIAVFFRHYWVCALKRNLKATEP